MNKRVSVLDILVDPLTMQQAVAKTEEFILSGQPSLIMTANTEMVMLAQEDKEFAEIFSKAQLVLPDGAGIVLAARYTGDIMPERVAGYDLVQNIFALAAKKGYRVFLFGSKPEILEKAKKKALAIYPGLQIAGTRHGFFTFEDEKDIIENITTAKPDILLAALGMPKQEKWLAKHLSGLNVPVGIGVGGTFDVMAGAVNRAPLWLQKMNLEWLYRLKQQPWRIVRMLALPKFIFKIIFQSKKS